MGYSTNQLKRARQGVTFGEKGQPIGGGRGMGFDTSKSRGLVLSTPNPGLKNNVDGSKGQFSTRWLKEQQSEVGYYPLTREELALLRQIRTERTRKAMAQVVWG